MLQEKIQYPVILISEGLFRLQAQARYAVEIVKIALIMKVVKGISGTLFTFIVYLT